MSGHLMIRKVADMYDTGGGLMVVAIRGIAELPCRLVDPDLFFAEAPADVEEAKALCLDCPIRAACLAGRAEAAGAVGRLGRRAVHRRCRRGPQAAAGPSAEVSGRRTVRSGG